MGDDPPATARDGAPPVLSSEVAARLATAGFAALWHGRSLTPGELLPANVEQAVDAAAMLVAQGRAELNDAGRVVGMHGLTLRNTRHRFDVCGRRGGKPGARVVVWPEPRWRSPVPTAAASSTAG